MDFSIKMLIGFTIALMVAAVIGFIVNGQFDGAVDTVGSILGGA